MPDVATNAQGTPLLSDMFMTGQALASNPVVCWANADIIFTPEVMRAARVVTDRARPAYLIGRRTDVDQLTPLDLSDGWSDQPRGPRSAGGRAQASKLDRLLHVHAGTVRRASAVRDRAARIRPVADLASRRSRRRRHRCDRLRAGSPPTPRLLARRQPRRRVRRDRGAHRTPRWSTTGATTTRSAMPA